MPSVLVTGAARGIGRSIVEHLNNAGIVVSGPMESVTPDGWRKQLEINVIGQLAVTQAVLTNLPTRLRDRVLRVASAQP